MTQETGAMADAAGRVIGYWFSPINQRTIILSILSIHVQISSLFHPVPPKRGLHH
jgi:hypothetical protein